MLRGIDIVAFDGGRLRRLGVQEDAREAVLALPLNRLVIKMVRVPSGSDAREVARPILQAVNPFPDEALTISCETVRETEGGTDVIAAALPESAAEDLGEALDAAKLSVLKIDVAEFGLLRGLAGSFEDASMRRLVLVRGVDAISLLVMDGDAPCEIRAFSAEGDFRREIMLSLLEAEDFNGPKKLAEIIVVANGGPELDLEALAQYGVSVRTVEVGENADLVGIGDRSDDESTLNAMPESWREVLNETRFKRKLIRQVAIAGGIWAVIMGVLFGVPLAYGFMTDHQKDLSRQHAKQYKVVREMKEKTDIVKKYSDHARGALEVMKSLSDNLPEGIELSSWDYRREDGVSVSGEGESESLIYDFKDAVAKLGVDEDDEDQTQAIFPEVELSGLSASRNGQKFKLTCLYKAEEEE